MIKIGRSKPLIFIRNAETYVDIECLIYVLIYYNMTDSNLFINSKQQLIDNRRAKLGQIQGGLQRAIQDSTKGGLQ